MASFNVPGKLLVWRELDVTAEEVNGGYLLFSARPESFWRFFLRGFAKMLLLG
ncbi:MAG: hypothetical protein NZM25_11450 [Leptospiraceae bacterium]|nr:hypothetical protein [Leptospiraceae bacterium]MDW8307447.1 hypothetical protein [Leptospiraceae bacterium]